MFPPQNKKKRLDLKCRKKETKTLFSPPLKITQKESTAVQIPKSCIQVLFKPVTIGTVKPLPLSKFLKPNHIKCDQSNDPSSNQWTPLPPPNLAHLTRKKIYFLPMEDNDELNKSELCLTSNQQFANHDNISSTQPTTIEPSTEIIEILDSSSDDDVLDRIAKEIDLTQFDDI